MSVISRDCQLGDHGVCSLGFGCVCKCHHPSVDERIGATERQEQARTIEDCHARIAELERQVEELKSKLKLASGMIGLNNAVISSGKEVMQSVANDLRGIMEGATAEIAAVTKRAETAEANLSGVQAIIDLFNQLEPDWDWKKLQDELISTPLPPEPPASTVRLILNILCSTTLDLVGESKARETAEARVKALEGAAKDIVDTTEGHKIYYHDIWDQIEALKSALEQKENE